MASGRRARVLALASAISHNSQSEVAVPGSNRNCHKCDQDDSIDDMVCCDACSSWEHFQCAGVTGSIANPDRSWKCSRCLDDGEESVKSATSFNESSVSKSTKKSQILHLSLALLEEQQELKRKQMKAEEEFLKQKYNLLMQIQDADEEGSRSSAVSAKTKREHLENWLSKGATEGDTGLTKPVTPALPLALKSGTTAADFEQPCSNQVGNTVASLYSSANAIPEDIMAAASSSGFGKQLPQLGTRTTPPDKTPISTRTLSGTVNTIKPTVSSTPNPVSMIVDTQLHPSGNSVLSPLSVISAPMYTTCLLQQSTTKADGNRIVPVLPPSPMEVQRPVAVVPKPVQLYTSVPVRANMGILSNNQQPKTMTAPIPILRHHVPRTKCVQMTNPSSEHQQLFVPTPEAASNPMFEAPELITFENPVHLGRNQLPVSNPAFGIAPEVHPCGRETEPPAPAPERQLNVHRVPSSQTMNTYGAPGPTNAQLAARQVMPRELPKFNGDPQEWPIFYSSFKNTTEVCGYSDAENLARLQRCLSGPALEAVRSRLLLPASVPSVIGTLHKLYGRPEILINSLLKSVRSVPPPKADNLNSIIAYGLAVHNLVDHVVLSGQQTHLANPMLLQELVDKLPVTLRMQWGSFKRSYASVDLATFNSFMEDLVNVAADLSLDVGQISLQPTKSEKSRQKEKLYTHAHQLSSSPEKDESPSESAESKACSYCGNVEHQIQSCGDFKALDMDGRWKAVRQKNLCRTCLVPHRKWPCRSKKECGMEGCRIRHHMLLHSNRTTAAVETNTQHDPVHHNHHHTKSFSLFRYIPVTLYGNGKQICTYAFLDDGSSSTLIEEGIADQLGLTGEPDTLWLSWTGKIGRHEKTSRRVSLKISGDNRNDRYQMENVRTVRELGLPCQTLNYASLSEAFPHLKGLPLVSYVAAKPTLIIGLEHARLLTTLKAREGNSGDPVASKTRLGWCVFGRNTGGENSVEQLHHHTSEEITNVELHDAMRQFFAVEEAAVTSHLPSEADQRAINILEKTTVRNGRRYQTGLLWKIDNPTFPDSYSMAMRRLIGLEKRLARDPQLNNKVKAQIEDYRAKGYAHIATTEELEQTHPHRVWYLPLGVVTSTKKPDKVRLVWDAAASVNGVSFNDLLLKGPDLITSLPAVLLRFRQRNVAVCGDIREMFHQIEIRPEDKQSQRFLWRENPNDDVQIWVMDVATFGATCSPATAQYVKNQHALQYQDTYPQAVNVIIEDHYVDDCLVSVDTVEEAVKLMREVKAIHSAAGFDLRKFQSNSPEVLSLLGDADGDSDKPLKLDGTAKAERVLGLVWVPSEDVFTFDKTALADIREMTTNGAVPTKRQLLRTVMKLFDPLGFIAHYVVLGKMLLQQVWRTGTDWDEPLAEHLRERWSEWVNLLENITEVKVPRCFFGGILPEAEEIQLHVFVDAGEDAYACVAYLRMIHKDGGRCAFVAAKSKVAPLKPLSIPRLELQAALMGARLMQSVCSAVTLNITKRFLWTDSATVLAWLRSDNRRYHQFVSFRVAEILTLTSVDEWRHVPSKLNVADEATKWRAAPEFSPSSRWYQGPDFLWGPETQWPCSKKEFPVTTDEEVRVVAFHHAEEPLIVVERFSNWNRMVRATAYFHRAVSSFKSEQGEIRNPVLSSEEITAAEVRLWSQAQAQAFPTELNDLKKGGSVSKSSPLHALTPFLDDYGVIRVGGRLENAPYIPYEMKHPIVLPQSHRITYLLVDSYHRRFLHGNGETVCNEVRQLFNIPHLRAVIRRVSGNCQHCKVQKATPTPPLMGPLPRVRLTPFVRAFTYVGVDYFGPVEVKVGRSIVKRWICLFTCLTIRAVHLELTHSLSTNSCVMAFRRFVVRRGAPLEVYSDNGTNFVGANRLLCEEKEKLQNIYEECADTFTNAYTTWHFNVPAAPHMGGPWERMVRSVKSAMRAISDSPRYVSDEVLETIMLEAEGIINSRPLTYVPLESANQEALTPNHFLMYGSSGVKQPVAISKDIGNVLRDSWKLAQHITNDFWRRWVREYLPMITRRTKWFDSVKPLEPGDLVVIVDGKCKNQWERGRVLETYPGKDGQVRNAKIQTARGVFARPAVKLAVLDVAGPRKIEDGVPETEVVHGSGDVATTSGHTAIW